MHQVVTQFKTQIASKVTRKPAQNEKDASYTSKTFTALKKCVILVQFKAQMFLVLFDSFLFSFSLKIVSSKCYIGKADFLIKY